MPPSNFYLEKGHRLNAKKIISTISVKLDKAVATRLSTPTERQKLKQDLNLAYIDEELFWKHKSKNSWIKEGDRNTKFFHIVSKTKMAMNKIRSIMGEDGVIYKGDSEITGIATQYFINIFKSGNISDELLSNVFKIFPQRLTKEMNMDLTKEVTHDKIRLAVYIGPHRAPGPDGFTWIFYHQFWNDINLAVVKEVKMFFEEGRLDHNHNHTNICLIPKTSVSYKIIFKILVSRLKKHLSGLISEQQAAFILGRMITYNNIIAHELFYALKSRKKQSKTYMETSPRLMTYWSGSFYRLQ